MPRIPLYYTFGNHMHWVDMEWLWGYHVLPGSVRDMLRFCAETGAKGNVNFDGVGYEKLAAEDPEALAELREATRAGTIEPVGCSYGQPYGLFHGGESNVRQRIYGVRAVMRLLGVRPKTFWEEEFDFFPQLPQMLRGVGFEYASLFFQWTWHTPEIPKEEIPVILWEGQDGSRLVCATRNHLNLHQWPEDMDLTFAALAGETADEEDLPPLILQWLELMPSQDWMCRSEVLLPKMRELLADERFEIRMATLGEYLGSVCPDDVPVRPYSMDEVWHGMTLGKNGDQMRRQSQKVETELLAAETLSAINGLAGRPYAQWDVYPTWELEELWRNLLMAQHHDNDECEGLCGHVGFSQYDQAWSDSYSLVERQVEHVAKGFRKEGDNILLYNPLGWTRKWHVVHRDKEMTVVDVPAFGWTAVPRTALDVDCGGWTVEGRVATFVRGVLKIVLDLDRATITHFANAAFPEGLPIGEAGLWEWTGTDVGNVPYSLKGREISWDGKHDEPRLYGSHVLRLPVEFAGHPDEGFTLQVQPDPHHEGVEIFIKGSIPRPKGGMNEAFGWRLAAATHLPKIKADQPYGVSALRPNGKFLKKYPEGDWMTSPQWFEEVERPFTGGTFVDFQERGQERGLQVVFEGCRQWFVEDGHTVRNILHAYDPWDEDKDSGYLDNRFLFLPHGPTSKHELWQQAQEFLRECWEEAVSEPEDERLRTFSALSCDAPNVLPTAFYRETEDYSGRHLETYVGRGMGYPYILRLVEFDGLETEVSLKVAGTVAKAYKTNLMGEIEEELGPDLRLKMRPYEIATIYLDIVEGRKEARDLDAKRQVWATVHRVD